MRSHRTAPDCKETPAVAGWVLFFKGDTMPRASTFVFFLAAFGLYVIGMTTPAQFALFLGMACEVVFWKRAGDKLRAIRIARRTAPGRNRRY
jgi:hypothetical protein